MGEVLEKNDTFTRFFCVYQMLLLISHQLETPKNSHSCLKLWKTMFSREDFLCSG